MTESTAKFCRSLTLKMPLCALGTKRHARIKIMKSSKVLFVQNKVLPRSTIERYLASI